MEEEYEDNQHGSSGQEPLTYGVHLRSASLPHTLPSLPIRCSS